MKTIIVTCTLGLLLATVSHAQEIKPSEQAQGMTRSQNTAVDYSTGIFSYRVPLFELSSGDYKLPVALSYTANGVKVKDKPGVCGHGWNLLAGGVVTRTVRGGIPDEKYHVGYAYDPLTTLTDSIRKLVNKHEKDGESDIFTAVFNGRRMNFIILPLEDSLRRVRAVPLEKTSVRIDNNSMGEILSWRITDEDGIVYIFDEVERTTMVDIEEGVSSNSVTGNPYNSSWYLTRIIIPSAPDIKFRYTDQRLSYDNPYNSYYQDYTDHSNMLYFYGQPLSEYLFDLTPHQDAIGCLWMDAHVNANMLSLNIQASHAMIELDNLMSINSSIQIKEKYIDELALIDEINGFIGSIERLSYTRNQVISLLNSIIDALKYFDNMYARFLETDLHGIQQIYMEAATTVTHVDNKSSYLTRTHRIYPKFLTGITCGDQEMTIKYGLYGEDRMMQEIALLNYFRDTITSVQLEQQGRLLRKITIKSPKTLFSKVQQFSYFDALNNNTGEDIFGYYNGTPLGLRLNTSGTMYPYITVPSELLYKISNNSDLDLGNGSHDSQHVKRYSLKNIKTSGGGEIELDYESNQLHFFGNNIEFGGLRLKNMLLRDENGNVDSIRYHYTREDGKGSGKFVLNGLSQGKTLYYAHCIDNVLMEGVEDIGNGILNTGNNGIIYDYVREECTGSGSTAYYFFVPLVNYGISNEGYPYWLMGLPLGKIEYDETGHMVSMQKNKYAIHALSLENNLQDFFQITNDYAPFNKVAKQLKPFGFYIDGEKLENDYKSRPNVMLYRNRDFVYMMNPYRDQYLPNIAPRTYTILPDQAYVLYYGGKVILEETNEYLFNYTPDSSTTASEPKYMDLYSMLPSMGYVMDKTSFHYSSKHHDPVRVTRTKSNGEQVNTYRRIVADLDFEETNPVLQEMITGNMLSSILQEQVFLTRDSITKLIAERRMQYDKDSMEEKKVYFPARIFDLSLPEPQEVSALPSINSFTYPEPSNENDYTVTKFSYNKPGKVYRLEESIMPGEVHSVVHDKGNGEPVLTAKNIRRAGVDAMDKYRVLEMTGKQSDLMYTGIDFAYSSVYDNLTSRFNDFLSMSVLIENVTAIQGTSFTQGELHRAMKNYALFFHDMQNDDWYMGQRDTIIAHGDSLVNKYANFLENDVHNGFRDFYAYLFYAECVLNYARYFTIERMEECKFNVNPDLVGLNMGFMLKVTPQEYLYNLYYVVNSSQGDNGMFNCKVIYSDGSYHTFSKPFTIASSGWRVNVLEIDLHEIPGKENIVFLEVSPVSYTSLSRGIALSALVPAGTEFEAVSRDQLGRVFCKLNHLQQFERYEYDGLGRVVKVFDARGDVLQEFGYNEIAITN